MKNQFVNILFILIAASCVFTLFWKPARKPGPTMKMTASDLLAPSTPTAPAKQQ